MTITAALLLKAPRPGFVKTRLAADLGAAAATTIYRHLVEHQLREIPRDWRCTIHFAPADAGLEMRSWLKDHAPPGSRFSPQVEGDLGARMRQAAIAEFAAGADAVVLLGGDCPALVAPLLSSIGDALATADIVIIPATDGGYVLLAFKRDIPDLFEGIPWSTAGVLKLTLARAGALGLGVRLLSPLTDVDDLPSLEQARAAGYPGRAMAP